MSNKTFSVVLIYTQSQKQRLKIGWPFPLSSRYLVQAQYKFPTDNVPANSLLLGQFTTVTSGQQLFSTLHTGTSVSARDSASGCLEVGVSSELPSRAPASVCGCSPASPPPRGRLAGGGAATSSVISHGNSCNFCRNFRSATNAVDFTDTSPSPRPLAPLQATFVQPFHMARKWSSVILGYTGPFRITRAPRHIRGKFAAAKNRERKCVCECVRRVFVLLAL